MVLIAYNLVHPVAWKEKQNFIFISSMIFFHVPHKHLLQHWPSSGLGSVAGEEGNRPCIVFAQECYLEGREKREDQKWLPALNLVRREKMRGLYNQVCCITGASGPVRRHRTTTNWVKAVCAHKVCHQPQAPGLKSPAHCSHISLIMSQPGLYSVTRLCAVAKYKMYRQTLAWVSIDSRRPCGQWQWLPALWGEAPSVGSPGLPWAVGSGPQ